ncbi:transcription termination factor [Podospora didyma]|uniref:Transcription termination factor n=1 Tax=Podospora didyma TaxID=330526 RepID=A0AAE0U4I0_9PEZI|nr:transcription termination factor [Podospora didyma]
MVGREREPPNSTHGGMLADSMGLGKTLETLGCIAANKPSEEDIRQGAKTTLIVVPVNAVAQWIDEVIKHFNEKISVAHYKASNKQSRAWLDSNSIWITSYEISSQYPTDKITREIEGTTT